MDILQIIILAVVQGVTEFLPISSSAHLILFPQLTGWADQGIAFDVAVHLGSLVAVLMYFRQDLKPLLTHSLNSLRTLQFSPESRLVWGVAIGTLPVGFIGLAIASVGLEEQLRLPIVIASTTIIFGLLLWVADVIGEQKRNEYSLTWSDILLIGLAQALALIPGTSRSGITMTAALLLGLNRQAAARFSFLLSIPVILLAGIGEPLIKISQNMSLDWFALLLGGFFSAISAYLCIHAFMRLLERVGMLPFVIYRLGLGLILLIWMV